jgi:dipeptidase D
MERKISQLQPVNVWTNFEAICTIPRPSKKEEKMIAFLEHFALENKLEFKKDEVGNVLISKKATTGYENRKKVVLQSHLDMVCEKNSPIVHDFDNDPILPYIDGEWVKAEGTTLGADCGIGIAAQMAVLTDQSIQHGPIECLFTVDEETGLTGAFALQPGFLSGDILINLDSEDEGELFIGCAGGIDTVATLNYRQCEIPSGFFPLQIKVSGLLGGHSGDDINKGRANAIKILVRFLWDTFHKYGIKLARFDGGNLRNAIPREASASILILNGYKEKFVADFNVFIHDLKAEISITEPSVKVEISSTELPDYVVDDLQTERLLNVLYACPHGVQAMSYRMPGLVETSTNLASVKMKDIGVMEITTSQRSDIESGKKDISSMVEAAFQLAGATIIHSDGYPGWTPNPESEILKIAAQSYIDLFSSKPVIRSIHAGLECGLFLKKYPQLDMVSFGPTIKGAHSPDERINIATVDKFWKLLVKVLENIPVSN